MNDWQPIETAPKDGTAVVLFSPADFGNVPNGLIWISGGWRAATGGWRGDYGRSEPCITTGNWPP